MHSTLVSNDLIFDVGMHLGEDSEFYLKKGFRVVGFEANPDLVDRCRTRLRRWIDNGRLCIVEGAIVDDESLIDENNAVNFYQNNGLSVWGTACSDWADRNSKLGAPSTIIKVPAISFETALLKHGIPYYLKVDIEGCDMICLKTLRLFTHKPSYVSFESSLKGMTEIESEISLLQQLGFEAFQAIEQSQLHIEQASCDPPREGIGVVHVFEEGASGLFGRELQGDWVAKEQILAEYERICRGYAALGENGIASRLPFRNGGVLYNLAQKLVEWRVGQKASVWYDTHARHCSVK